ncbi:hypothetical protein HPC49_32065 [Pyxidicoccus fallax]|uniref:Lipoprotein n=1 Tax=Pyxidicoccus fallax TaxID=394095 RepID=A0A848LST0_9BACT|nr:hypothetical protein [Pyxidicoccus fallax]NMO20563.1 hypothetical protein [Pyxidicoccus fallax]NPC82847.1 hypothetical protein [Pyxidicoccus fallax]
MMRWKLGLSACVLLALSACGVDATPETDAPAQQEQELGPVGGSGGCYLDEIITSACGGCRTSTGRAGEQHEKWTVCCDSSGQCRYEGVKYSCVACTPIPQ